MYQALQINVKDRINKILVENISPFNWLELNSFQLSSRIFTVFMKYYFVSGSIPSDYTIIYQDMDMSFNLFKVTMMYNSIDKCIDNRVYAYL